ncbi:Protein FIZZY-related 3 [Vitis vinifera]|uniref:Protein FIZZY-related 3 n=1 Tax=Vitis vinifera TaxID=29760 RepID=A0A438H9H1_VITVI|nr:Protein FIZZY-related 3 [Vitis vinifera]
MHFLMMAKGQPILILDFKSSGVWAEMSHNDRELASSGNDNQLVLKLTDLTAAVKAIAWSPHQSSLLASGGGTADWYIRFWSMQSAWSKNVNELVSTHGYSQNQIMVWKHPSMTKVTTLTGHSLLVLYLAMSWDGQAEKWRRDRINSQLATLSKLIPKSEKLLSLELDDNSHLAVKKVDGRGQDAEREFELLVLDSAESDLPSEKPSRNASDHAWETHGSKNDNLEKPSRDNHKTTPLMFLFWPCLCMKI